MTKTELKVIEELKEGELKYGKGNEKVYCDLKGEVRTAKAVRSLIEKGLLVCKSTEYKTYRFTDTKWENYTEIRVYLA